MIDNILVRKFVASLLDSVDEGTILQKDAYKIIANAFSNMSEEIEEE